MRKPSLSIPDQVTKLTDRGLVDSRNELTRALISHGYYRLSGYWRYLQLAPREGRNAFEHGSDFADVYEIYRIDAELRNLLLEGLCEIETALRAILVSKMCVPGEEGLEYLDPASYVTSVAEDGTQHRVSLLSDVASDISRSRERHVRHYKSSRPGKVPMWVAVEAMSFGTVSRMYGLLADDANRTAIAARFGYGGVLTPKFASNIRAVSVFRNVCAHNGRIWNRHVQQDVPRILREFIPRDMNEAQFRNTSWGIISVITHMVGQIRRDASFQDELNRVVPSSGTYWQGLTSPSSK